jgi:nitrosocyanin
MFAVLAALVSSSAFAATKVTFTNKLIDGKKVWVPNTTDIKAGEDLDITLVNPLAEPHGFAMADIIGADVVVNAGETKTVKGKAPKSGEFKFHCQLHPVHVGGALNAK